MFPCAQSGPLTRAAWLSSIHVHSKLGVPEGVFYHGLREISAYMLFVYAGRLRLDPRNCGPFLSSQPSSRMVRKETRLVAFYP